MTEVLSSPYFIGGIFFLIALIYSSVGLGGGSSYTALMAIFGFNALSIPVVSLTLNLVVTTAGSFNFIRNKHARIKLIVPFLMTSIPMAFLGGALQLPKQIFFWVLLVSLVFVAARIYLWDSISLQLLLSDRQKLVISLIAGSLLGLIAGIAGIGGGIYLIPLILILGLGTEKEAAACGAIFVWLNSASGLLSRMQFNAVDLSEYVPYIVAVFIGGSLGSFMGSSRFSARTLDRILGVVILVAIGFLFQKLVIQW
jgi:hypothetical protein